MPSIQSNVMALSYTQMALKAPKQMLLVKAGDLLTLTDALVDLLTMFAAMTEALVGCKVLLLLFCLERIYASQLILYFLQLTPK